MGFSKEEFESLAKLVDSGKNTYADIHRAFPHWNDRCFYDLIGDPFNDPFPLALNPDTIMLFFEECPEDYTHDYQFKATDTFCLSVTGCDILYQPRKEKRYETLALVSAIASVIAAICSLISIIRC